jgi:hypothetical protein
MARPYASFLVRCWRLGDGEQRIKLEHIQSGEGTQVATWQAALAWLRTRSEIWPADPVVGLEPTPPERGGQDAPPGNPATGRAG